MDPIKNILKKLDNNEISAKEAEEMLKKNLSESLSYATIDHGRSYFKNFPEVIYADKKTNEQVTDLAIKIYEKSSKVMVTKASKDKLEDLKEKFSKNIEINELAGMAFASKEKISLQDHKVLVICAGTTDIPIAEEAIFTLACLGIDSKKLYDVGIAGLSRVIHNLDIIRSAKTIITVAGMEGALPSVISGLTSSPVIAVPTSIGYGSNINGLSALLTMLNSCSPGIGVVNIDNGFGAGFLAWSFINSLNS
ncbi:MAG: 1-(5-phosphoribosyl)-5-amino-4-imidazole-carboxylate carboxylase [Dehalococcoidia bacterium]|nr:1-(5-phosphoribosyl)-5-amino-4-imidazole-carboxylate carboxylase [Dehalococcoidia bacterium]MEC9450934.1 nickel pincer cofactor biosynthesis protein LarB [Chloroflexota bacterium]|tara:strand:+ start:699 stop:1451 length:753 start_codon:yes stop_codon:yes gene_type:complete